MLPGLVAGVEASMRPRPARKAVRVVIYVVIIVVILALPFWLGTGIVVLSP
jgi:fatty acid desaturase